LEYQLSLLSRLCFGRNKKNIEIVSTQFISLEQAMAGLKDPQLPGKIRSAYCDYLLNVFIDVDKNQPVLKRIRVISEALHE